MARILIVDEKKSLCRLYRMELAEEGHDVVVAYDGESGIRMAREARPDLVVIETEAHGDNDGVECVSSIQREHKATPIVINTVCSPARGSHLVSGVDAYVLKSADLTPLKSAIHRALTKRQKNPTST
jgi:two-component system OmpR family response regulator